MVTASTSSGMTRNATPMKMLRTKANESRIAKGLLSFSFLGVGYFLKRCRSINPRGTLRKRAKITPIKSGLVKSVSHVTAPAT